MPDITMCDTQDCPLKDTCYRFTATPSEYRQSYFLGDPRGEDKKECSYYAPIEKP
jgi:hypothetical protein